jgi:hypothetical protein
MLINIHRYVYAHTYLHIHVCTHVPTYSCMHTRTHTYIPDLRCWMIVEIHNFTQYAYCLHVCMLCMCACIYFACVQLSPISLRTFDACCLHVHVIYVRVYICMKASTDNAGYVNTFFYRCAQMICMLPPSPSCCPPPYLPQAADAPFSTLLP